MRRNRFRPLVRLNLSICYVLTLAFCAKADPNSAILESEIVRVGVTTNGPRIVEYLYKPNGGRLLGSVAESSPAVEIKRKQDGKSRTLDWDKLMPVPQIRSAQISWHCIGRMDGEPAVEFDYVIAIQDNIIEISTQNIRELPGYDLVAFKFPSDPIIRVTRDLPEGKICTGNLSGPGRLVSPGEAVPAQFDFGLVTTEKVAAGIYCNVISHPLRGGSSDGSAGIWCGDFRYSFKDENYEPFSCQVALVADRNGDGRVDWQDAAGAIHDLIPKRVNLRMDAIKYMADHGLNFADFVKSVRQICYVTDGWPQICLLAGWNGWGWDSEYPACDYPGEEFGGREGLYALHREARQYNCAVSMIHNFDDAYQDSPAWDPGIIAVRQDGSLWGATWWSGGPSYIISPYKFWKSGAAKRTIDTLIAQGLERQIFSDVFSMVPYRESRDRGDESDPLTNLVLGKFKVLEYLRQHDIYMNSEGFNYEMLGRWIGGHSGFNPGLSHDPNQPPLSLFITHGLMSRKYWGMSAEGRFVGGDTEVLPNPWNLEADYLWAMLISFYGDKPMRRFSAEGNTYRATYGADTEVAWERNRGVRVTLAGRLISDGASCLLPKPGKTNVFLAFTRSDEPMLYPKPVAWTDLSHVVVMKLSAEQPPQVIATTNLVRFEGEQLVLNLPKGVPHKIFYGRENIAAEQTWPTLPPKELTYPLDEVMERIGGQERPDWVLKKTRKALQRNPSQERLAVGCSGCFATQEAARRHAASIVARKIAWFIRQKYVNRSREYERACGWNNGAGDMGYDNWQLGYTAARRIFTEQSVSSRPGAQWYAEKVRHGPERRLMWKAFVATPITAAELQQVYIAAGKDRLAECQEQLRQGKTGRVQLERNIKVYEKLLAEEPARSPVKLDWDMW